MFHNCLDSNMTCLFFYEDSNGPVQTPSLIENLMNILFSKILLKPISNLTNI